MAYLIFVTSKNEYRLDDCLLSDEEMLRQDKWKEMCAEAGDPFEWETVIEDMLNSHDHSHEHGHSHEHTD